MHLPLQAPAVGPAEDCGSLCVMQVQPGESNCAAVVSWVESQVGAVRESVFPVVLVTYGDLFELSESLLMLMGWVQDCSFLFVPVAIYAKALRFEQRHYGQRRSKLERPIKRIESNLSSI